MTSKQFFKYLVEPEQLNDSSVVEMEQLIKQFPFFQTAHLLYLKALNRINPKLVKEGSKTGGSGSGAIYAQARGEED